MPHKALSCGLDRPWERSPCCLPWVSGVVPPTLRYLNGTQDLGLYFSKNQDLRLVGYADAGYLSDPHNARSKTGFVFICGGTAISWTSCKQTLVATSTNHSEIIALYEAARECYDG